MISQSTVDGCIPLYMYMLAQWWATYLFPICPVNGNIVMYNLTVLTLETPQSASQTSHHRSCSLSCNFRLRKRCFAISLGQLKEITIAGAPISLSIKLLLVQGKNTNLTFKLNGLIYFSRTSSTIFRCNIGIIIFVCSSFPCCRCSLMAPSSSSKDEFRLISLM